MGREQFGAFRALSSRILERKREYLEKPENEYAWSLRRGIVVLDKPELLCPFCSQGFKVSRIYVVDTFRKSVLYCAEEMGSGTRQVILHRCHPHVGDGGSICMGSSEDAIQALTMGLNPGNGFFNVPDWVIEMGHKCSKNPNDPLFRCNLCRELVRTSSTTVTRTGGTICSACTAARTALCAGCKERDYLENMWVNKMNIPGVEWLFIHQACIPAEAKQCLDCETAYMDETCPRCFGGDSNGT